MASVTLHQVNKIYGSSVCAVKNVSLEIQDAEFVVLVGPSGCGKTTVLRLISGLEETSSGDILIDSKRMNNISPKDRDIAMVFQNYALYPHMNVYENMAFALKLRKISKIAIEERVKRVSELLGIQHLLQRKPRELSGGQRQRVAMGRAIVREPKVFLMDEPLSNLDAQLRAQMRIELQKLHRQLGVTTLYVTHDQTEAMTLGSRIVVMKEGTIQQVDTPLHLYEQPVNQFVAEFIGNPPMNFLIATVESTENKIFLKGNDFQLSLPDKWKVKMQDYHGKQILFGIRPEDVQVRPASGFQKDSLGGQAEGIERLGGEAYLHFKISQKNFISKIDPRIEISPGSMVNLTFDLGRIYLFDPLTYQTIR